MAMTDGSVKECNEEFHNNIYTNSLSYFMDGPNLRKYNKTAISRINSK